MATRRDEEEEISPLEEGEVAVGTSTRGTARPNLNTEEPSVPAMIGSLSERMAIDNQMMMEMIRGIRATAEAVAIGNAPMSRTSAYPKSPGYAPIDPDLPKPRKALIDDETG